MFKLIFGALAAWNQVGLIVGGALFGGIGALLLGSRLHWRLRATRVIGTVIGVRPAGTGTFFPVYRYTLPNGVSAEATSDTGRSPTDSMTTGSEREIFVFPEHPDKAAEADGWIEEIFGGFFLAAGLVLFYIALIIMPFTRYTAVMAVVLALYATAKFRKFVPAPGDRPRTPLTQRLQRMSAETAPVTPIEKLAESADVQVRIERQRASLRKAAPLFAIFGAALLVLACYLTKATARLEAGGVRATGTVVGLHLESSSNSSTYHALVRFTDLSGTDIQFKDSVGSNPPSHRAGDTVTVLYLPGDAQRSATVDRGVWNWIGPVAAGAFGLLLVTLAVRGWRRPRQSSPSQAALNH